MIGNSWSEYVFIRIAIFALRLVAPLSIVYLAASYHADAFLLSPFLGVYALIEAAFYFFVYLPRSYYLQREAKHPPRMSRAEREALFCKCANSMTAESITGWFLRASGGQIWRDNVVDWLLWALFSSRSKDTHREWEEELDHYITAMGEYVGYPLRPGSNPEMQCLRLTMDPVPMVHRPFIWYMLVCLVDTLTSIALFSRGFTHHNTRKWFHAFPPRPLLALLSRPSRDAETNIPYWYRPHRSRTKLPILFIHGIGIGLLPYIPFLRDLAAQDPDVGILAIEILPITMHITAPPLGRDAMCAAITRILDAHGLHRFVLVGHSYGTAISAHLLRRQWGSTDRPSIPLNSTVRNENGVAIANFDNHVTTNDDNEHSQNGSGSDRIAAALLIDPVPFLLHHPSVAYNFVYRKPRRANEWQLWYFASREPDTARALSRHFFWFESILFREDVLAAASGGGSDSGGAVAGVAEGKKERERRGKRKQPLPITVSLAGRDQIVDAPAVHAYLTGGNSGVQGEGSAGSPSRWAQDAFEVLYFPELDHATVFDTPKDRAPLLGVLRRFVRQEEGNVGEMETDGSDTAVASGDELVDVTW
ncbi:hypothetical protein BC827DRAFT_882947 [Russula dissimulans]|nr:hypothetical protein BC827DRAFT_882947 [Russula dissimulans]